MNGYAARLCAAAAKLAEQELTRARALFDAKAVTAAELDSAQAKLDSARANVAGANARMNDASLSLVDTTLYAPLDGVVLSRSVEVGSLVASGYDRWVSLKIYRNAPWEQSAVESKAFLQRLGEWPSA